MTVPLFVFLDAFGAGLGGGICQNWHDAPTSRSSLVNSRSWLIVRVALMLLCKRGAEGLSMSSDMIRLERLVLGKSRLDTDTCSSSSTPFEHYVRVAYRVQLSTLKYLRTFESYLRFSVIPCKGLSCGDHGWVTHSTGWLSLGAHAPWLAISNKVGPMSILIAGSCVEMVSVQSLCYTVLLFRIKVETLECWRRPEPLQWQNVASESVIPIIVTWVWAHPKIEWMNRSIV